MCTWRGIITQTRGGVNTGTDRIRPCTRALPCHMMAAMKRTVSGSKPERVDGPGSVKSRLFAYLRRHTQGVPSRTLVEDAMHLSCVPEGLCRQLVESAADGDPQFVVDEHGFWRVQAPMLSGSALQEAVFTCVQVQQAQTASGSDEVVEVAAQRIRRGKPEDALHVRVRPTAAIGPEGTRLTGLRNTDLRQGRRLGTALKRLRRFGERAVWVAWDPARLMALFQAHADQIAAPITEPDLSVAKLAAKLWPEPRVSSIEDLAAYFELPWSEHRRAQPDLAILVEAFAHVLEELAVQGVRTVAQALEFQQVEVDEVDFSGYAFDREFLASLPTSPGVYLMKDSSGNVIYVGKSKDLRTRVSSYFASTADRDPKTQSILDALHKLEFEQTATELEALMREAALIAEHSPRLNTQTEVHERPAPYAKSNDLILVCDSAQGGVDVLFTSRGDLLDRKTLGENELDATELAEEIRRRYLARADAPASMGSQEKGTRGREIVASWVEANRERAITIDVRLCESADHAAQLLIEYAADVVTRQPRAYRI